MKKILLVLCGVFVITSFVLSLTSFLMIRDIAQKNDDDIMKVVYHVSDPSRVLFTLNNIKNHIEGVDDPKKLKIALIVNGPALKEFHSDKVKDEVVKLLDEFKEQGVHLNSCANTMDAQNVGINDLVAGFARIEEGGVVRIAQLQKQGYVYIRP